MSTPLTYKAEESHQNEVEIRNLEESGEETRVEEIMAFLRPPASVNDVPIVQDIHRITSAATNFAARAQHLQRSAVFLLSLGLDGTTTSQPVELRNHLG